MSMLVERQTFYKYLWSAILTSLSGILCVQIDGIIVSHLLGANAFAAIGVLMPLMQIQLTLCLLIGVGGALRLSYAVGAQDWEDGKRIFLITTILLAIACLPFVVLSGWSERVASWFCHEPSLMPLATKYGRVLLISAPVYMLLQGCGAMVRAEGFPKRILVAMVLANVLNLSMDILFIQVFHWGIAGAGWATTVSNIIAIAIILTHHTQRNGNRTQPTAKQPCIGHCSPQIIKDILIAGAPMALGAIAMFFRLSYLTSSTSAHLGAQGTITLSLILSVFLLVNLLAGGTSQALQPLAGQYIGQNNLPATFRTCRRSLCFTLLSSLAATILVIALAQPICTLYGINPTPTADGISDASSKLAVCTALRIFALSFAFYSLGYVLMVIHQVMGNKIKSMVIAVVQPLCVIPVFCIMLYANHSSFSHIWWAFPLAECISLILITSLSLHELRQIFSTPKGD